MEWVNSMVSFTSGVVLRLGLPIAVTLVLAWLLNRMDVRWQEEATTQSTAPVKNCRCWEVNGCSPEKRAACPAYKNQEIPCWQVFRGPGVGQLKPKCLSCKVFLGAPIPVQA